MSGTNAAPDAKGFFDGKAVTIEDLNSALKKLRGMPKEWVLISPNGEVWKGNDPLSIAAKATVWVPKL